MSDLQPLGLRGRYTMNAPSPGVIYSSTNQDPPSYFEGNPMAVQYLYAMAAWSDGLQLTLTGSVGLASLPWNLFTVRALSVWFGRSVLPGLTIARAQTSEPCDVHWLGGPFTSTP